MGVVLRETLLIFLHYIFQFQFKTNLGQRYTSFSPFPVALYYLDHQIALLKNKNKTRGKKRVAKPYM